MTNQNKVKVTIIAKSKYGNMQTGTQVIMIKIKWKEGEIGIKERSGCQNTVHACF